MIKTARTSRYPTHLSRRQVLAGLSGTLLVAGLPSFAVAESRSDQETWVSAQGASSNSFGIGWSGWAGHRGPRQFATGFRGHAVVQHAVHKNSVIFVSRRPGNQGLELDLTTGEIVGRFECKLGNHLFGHGCFSLDGRVFFTTEGDTNRNTGRIVARDADNYQVLDEWSSHGIGPHEIRLLPDGKTLVVANGGILTRPESGRKALNLATMESSLAYIDSGSGALVANYRLAEPKSSIRHLDVAADGTVAFAIQLQRAATDHNLSVPLAGVHRPGEAIALFEHPTAITDRMRDYVGSVAINESSRIVGFTSPRGNLAVFWNIDNGQFRGYHQLRDVCGIAVSPSRDAFVLSNSFGELRELDAVTLQERRAQRVKLPGYRFDNHLLIMRSA